jgi:large subunit ribosomal protein L15e
MDNLFIILKGLTSAGKKGRGLRGKGNKNKNNRPSRKGNWKLRNTIKLRRYR